MLTLFEIYSILNSSKINELMLNYYSNLNNNTLTIFDKPFSYIISQYENEQTFKEKYNSEYLFSEFGITINLKKEDNIDKVINNITSSNNFNKLRFIYNCNIFTNDISNCINIDFKLKKEVNGYNLILKNSDLIHSEYYWCISKDFFKSQTILKFYIENGLGKLGDNNIWAHDDNNQALNNFIILGPITKPKI